MFVNVESSTCSHSADLAEIVEEPDASYQQPDTIADMNSEFDTEDINTNEVNEDINSRREILCAILRALMLVDQMNGSHYDISDALELAKDLYCGNDSNLKNMWPKNWKETETLLKENGYRDPKELYVCLDNSHYAQWDVMDSPIATCRFCNKKGAIKYYYLGLPYKIEKWFSDPVMCDKMLGHWKDKGHWLSDDYTGANFTLKELWNGERFCERSWFWDPEKEWMLPCKCITCNSIFSTDEIIQSTRENEGFSLLCSECGTQQHHHLKFARGDPRNIALIGHWDGWTPFSMPGKHSCGM